MTGVCKELSIAVLLCLGSMMASAEESRTLLDMPAPMIDHYLSNMRDHMESLDQIARAIADGKYHDVMLLAEERLGNSAFERHGAAHLNQVMPEHMQELGGALHRASSRLAVDAHAAEQELTADAQKKVLMDFAAVTHTCTTCHAEYRVH